MSTALDASLMNYFGGLSSSQLNSLAGQNINQAVSTVGGTFETSFSRLNEDITNADNNITSTAYYIFRTQDLNNLASDVNSVAAGQVNAATVNASNVGRQYEINEWQNSNKLETLFFLQVLFLSLTFVSALVFLQHSGLISLTLLNFLIVLTSIYAVYVLVTRARFTNIRRNPRYWNKARFPSAGVLDNSKTKCPGQPAPVLPPPPPPAPTCNSNTIALLSQYGGGAVNANLNSFLGLAPVATPTTASSVRLPGY